MCKSTINAYYQANNDKRRLSKSQQKRWYYANFERHMVEKHGNLMESGEGGDSGDSRKSRKRKLCDDSTTLKQPTIKDVFKTPITLNNDSVEEPIPAVSEVINDSSSDSEVEINNKKLPKPIPEPVPEYSADINEIVTEKEKC